MADGHELLTPEETAKANEVSAQVQAVVAQAEAFQVRSDDEALAATEFLVAVKRAHKESEDARKFLVEPMKRHAAAIDAKFRPNREALERAERAVKGVIRSFREQQEAERAEERRRVEEENRRREQAAEEERRKAAAEAQAEREAAAREAAARQAAAERAERERMEAIERDRESRRARIAALGEDALERLAKSEGPDGELARMELDTRRKTREAQEAAARAAAAEEAAREAERAVREAPAAEVVRLDVEAPARLAVESGSITERKRWTFEVTDPAKLPDWALTPDLPEIRRRIKDGLRDCPGLRIYQTDDLAVRAR